MKLIASVIVRNELGRYLRECIGHLLEFCDEVRILDDGSTDGWAEALHGAWGSDGQRVIVKHRDRSGEAAFLTHAAARNELLQFTLDGLPTHILAIDADEFVSDGTLVRAACENRSAPLVQGRGWKRAWSLEMCEVWEASEEQLCVRQDGGWASHGVAMLWEPEIAQRQRLVIRDRADATGRTPDLAPPITATGAAVLHFGWTRESERQQRFQRYVGGKHAGTHVQSIMWPCERLDLQPYAWPVGLRDALLPLTRA